LVYVLGKRDLQGDAIREQGARSPCGADGVLVHSGLRKKRVCFRDCEREKKLGWEKGMDSPLFQTRMVERGGSVADTSLYLLRSRPLT